MTKQEIIKIISNAVPRIDKNIFGETGKNMIGSNQFRELAALCRHAECFDEIKLLIQYNEAKAIVEKWDKETKKNKVVRTSWASKKEGEKSSLADIVVECMNSIKEASGDDETQCMQNLSLFFGYFYWNARIWTAQNKLKYSQTPADKPQDGDNRGNNPHSDRHNNKDRRGRK